ncbi:MAG TPA: permease-like cell division protein FtsX [Acidimicrobiales bacterium]|nr:permease-like cell division protein FtsX [Acidimicrobiales bacterium]
MALSVDYVVRETVSNLRRNLLMTSAAVLTVIVSLSLLGGALLLKQGVSKATLQWRGGVELSIYLLPNASPSQSGAVERELKGLEEVKKVTYLDQQAAFKEFKTMFANDPDIVESLTPQDLPPAYRVVPKKAEFVESIGDRFKKRPGVYDVVFAKDEVETLLKVTRALQVGIVSVAAVLLMSASLLILNTIRMAIFSRRREVGVMKLVGATNWFIRVPFMLEGLVQGMVGGIGAFFLIYIGRALVKRSIQGDQLQLINTMVPSGGDAIGTGIFLVIVGAVVGAVGSGIAVRRFLDV